MKLLVVTAVEAERKAVLADNADLDVVAVGVGMAAAAAHTTLVLAKGGYDAVILAGIAGGFDGRADIGDIVVATRSVAGDLGADSPDGFITIDDLGFGQSAYETDNALRTALVTALAGARTGAVLSVNAVTGTAEGAAELVARHADAVAEAMEGYGVACAASAVGIAYAEVRTISNSVGPRDKGAWQIGEAFGALGVVGQALGKLSV